MACGLRWMIVLLAFFTERKLTRKSQPMGEFERMIMQMIGESEC